MKIEKVISGGQTGVDRGGLDAAISLGIPHGGWCPKGRKAEDGKVPEEYLLEEIDTPDYKVRTERNIQESDVTLVLHFGPPTGGTLFTIQTARRMKKVCHFIDLRKYPKVEDAVKRLRGEKGSVLNVAGPRESKKIGAQDTARKFLTAVFKELL